jgi:hypothetical protein
VIEFETVQPLQARCIMLAEKFMLLLEALLKSFRYPDGSVRVNSQSPHVPIELPSKKLREAAN